MANAQALEAISDSAFQTELGQFNVEINVPPRLLGGGVFAESRPETQSGHRRRRVGRPPPIAARVRDPSARATTRAVERADRLERLARIEDVLSLIRVADLFDQLGDGAKMSALWDDLRRAHTQAAALALPETGTLVLEFSMLTSSSAFREARTRWAVAASGMSGVRHIERSARSSVCGSRCRDWRRLSEDEIPDWKVCTSCEREAVREAIREAEYALWERERAREVVRRLRFDAYACGPASMYGISGAEGDPPRVQEARKRYVGVLLFFAQEIEETMLS